MKIIVIIEQNWSSGKSKKIKDNFKQANGKKCL